MYCRPVCAFYVNRRATLGDEFSRRLWPCRAKGCLGWTLGENDRFCAWCGTRLVELALEIHQRRDNRWFPLNPPLLAYDQRPELRLVIRNSGTCGTLVIRPPQFHCSAAWLKLDTSGITAPAVEAGVRSTSRSPLSNHGRGQPPRSRDQRLDVGVHRRDANWHGLRGGPAAGVRSRLPERRMQLKSDAANKIPATLVLAGRATVADAPTIEGGWGVLEWGAGRAAALQAGCPERRDAGPASSCASAEMLGDFQDNVMQRSGTARVKCRGMTTPRTPPSS